VATAARSRHVGAFRGAVTMMGLDAQDRDEEAEKFRRVFDMVGLL
jgi:hypothetical protein